MLVACFSLIVLYKVFTNLVPMACMSIIWLFGCHLHTAFKLQVIFMSYFGNCWPRLLFLFSYYCYSFRKQSHTLILCICLFIVFPQQPLNPLAYFNHILQRKFELLGVVSCCNLLEHRRKDALCTSESPCCMLALGKVQTGNWILLFLLILELLVSHRLPSLVLRVWPLILARKTKIMN